MNDDVATIHSVQRPRVKHDGWLYEYPSNEGYRSSGIGYSSDMVDLAMRNDDAEAFVYFMRLAGCDRTSITLDFCTMERYCKKREAWKCMDALARLDPA